MTIILLLAAWGVGIGLAGWATMPLHIWFGCAGAAALLAIGLRHSPGRRLPLLLAALALGGARMAQAAPVIDQGHVASHHDLGRITLKGTVVAEPALTDRSQQLEVAAETIRGASGVDQPITGRVLVRLPRFPPYQYGDRLALLGALESPPTDEAFDYRAYLARRGIHSLMIWPQVTLLEQGQGHTLISLLLVFKDRARGAIRRSMPDPAGALLTGILLGDDSGLPPALDQAFQTTGMSHIIAISGFNIAIVVALFARAGQPLFGQRGAVWFALGGIATYTVLVGAEAAVVRAALMGGLHLLTRQYLGRRTFNLAALFVAAGVMTLANPFTLWDVGFQLSFAATLSLMLYADPLARRAEATLTKRLGHWAAGPLLGLLNEAVIITVAAQILTLPLIVATFGRLSLVSLLANALILPAQPAVMSWGGVATLLSMVSPSLGQVPAWVAWLLLQYTIMLVRLLATVPGASVAVPLGPAGLAATYAALGGLTWWARLTPAGREDAWRRLGQIPRAAIVRRGALTASGLAATLSLLWAGSQPDGALHVIFLDVGQGDAMLIVTPAGRQLLVDGGLYPTRLNDQLGRHIPFWDRQLDLVVATHPDADHITGLPGVFERFAVAHLVTDGSEASASATMAALLAAAEAGETRVRPAWTGQVIDTGDGVRLAVLHPSAGFTAEGRNDHSVSLRLTYGAFSLVLTGDAEQAGERAILQSGQPLPALVLKAGHHGSRTSSNDAFLAAVRPQVIVISVGRDNRFGHPHEEVLARAAAARATVLRTDELGAIELITDGERLWWQARP